MDRSQIYPGPQNQELLFLGTHHRAHHLYYSTNFTDEPLVPRRADRNFWKFIVQKLKDNQFPAQLMECMKTAGFAGVLECYYEKVDNHLVTSLVERWRPETHTFHFPFGEATVTLEDVQILWGLPLGDEVVSGENYRWDPQMKQTLSQQYLGITLEGEDLTTNLLKLTTLYEKITIDWPTNDASEEEYEQIARCIILHLIGGTIFPDRSGNTVFFHNFQHLAELNICGQLSWASAALAYLYRNLCKAADPSAREIAGPLTLLQLWAWERIPQIAPKIRDRFKFTDGPFGARWRGKLSWAGVTRNSLPHYRSVFQCLNVDQFIWRPYEHSAASIRPEYKRGGECWNCETFLIFFEIVEPYTPSRVMRQFGLVQTIPINLPLTPDQHRALHKWSKKSGQRDWKNVHAVYVENWITRMGKLVTGSPCNGSYRASPEYMSWFVRRTAFFVQDPSRQIGSSTRGGNIGGRLEMLGQGMGEVHRIASQDNPYNLDDQLGGVRQMAEQYLNYAGAGYHLDYQTSHLASEVNPYDFPTQPCYNIDRPLTQRQILNTDTYFDYRQPLATNEQNLNNFENVQLGGSDFDQNTFNQTAGSAFSNWNSQASGSGYQNFSNQGASSSSYQWDNQEVYTPLQPQQTQSQSGYSSDFFNIFNNTPNYNQDDYNGPQFRGTLSPVPYRGDESSTQETQQEGVAGQPRRGDRNRVPTRCPLSGGPLYRPHAHH